MMMILLRGVTKDALQQGVVVDAGDLVGGLGAAPFLTAACGLVLHWRHWVVTPVQGTHKVLKLDAFVVVGCRCGTVEDGRALLDRCFSTVDF